ncbi:MAG: translation elongation factor [Dehalococcoidia bacterium]|nr:translation elongation factor [Dehalococcoidia bacterium]
MPSYPIERIRNVVLLSHGGAGKTSLGEAILFDTGVINRLGRVEEGTTVSDYDPDEVKRRISINTSVLPCVWKDHQLNILDTPGYADFVGEAKAAIRVADAAVFLVCAASGVEVGTELTWGYADERSLPRLIFVNRIDRDNADFLRTVEQIRGQFGAKCVPIQLPIGSQSSFQGVVDLMSGKALLGAKGEVGDVPEGLSSAYEEHREKLIEAIAESDDELIAKYLEGQELTPDELQRGLRAGVLAGSVVPILVGSALQNMAVPPLLDAICALAPSPKDGAPTTAHDPSSGEERALEADTGGPLAALVFKTTADPYVGKLSYFRVFSGAIKSDSQVWNPSKGKAERIGQLLMVRGKSQEPVAELTVGSIGAVAKLTDASTGDTLCQRETPLILESIKFPKPLFGFAVVPKTKADTDKMGVTLTRLVEEDPTLEVSRDPDTREIILSGLGESHVEIAVEKMHRKFGVEMVISLPKVPYKETISASVKAEYRHRKQTGGHGQYGHVWLNMEPLPRGSGVQFADKVVGGVVPKNYIPSVEKGVIEASQEGILARFPVVDIKATLYDGSYHPVDSSDMSFQIAGAQAFKKGMNQGQPTILEPVMNAQITVPENFMGDVIGDLNTKRAKVLGMTSLGGVSVIEAQVPLVEIQRYATDLRSMTQGRGTFTVEFSHYEEVPSHISQKIIEQAKKERGES